MSFIQKGLIRWILQPLGGFSNKVPEKIRDLIFVLCGFGIFFINVLNNTENISLRYLYILVLDCFLMGLMLFCTLPRDIAPIRFDWKTMVPWLGFTLFMLVAGVTKSVDYLADTMLLLVMFPVFFIVWNNKVFAHVVDLLTRIARLVATVFFIVSIICFPITGRKYASCFTNVNGFAFFLTILFALLLIGFIKGKRTSILRWYDLLLVGICWACTYYTNSRTGQLACLATAACTLLLLLIQEKKRIRCLLLDILPAILVIAICTWAVLPVFVGAHNSIKNCEKAITAFFNREDPVLSTEPTTPSTEPTTPSTEPTTPSTEPTTPGAEPTTPSTEPTTPSTEPTTPSTEPTTPSTEPTTPSTEPTTPGISAGEMMEDIQNIQNQKTETDGKTMNQFLTGRVDIWKGVLDHVTFWGHEVDETFTFEYKGKIGEHSTAHMTILDFAYDYGFLAGVFYLLFNLVAGVKSVVYALRHPKERWMLAPFAISIAYGCISIVASTGEVFGYMIALFYYLVQAPLMVKKQKD